jgi:hypothetical protein
MARLTGSLSVVMAAGLALSACGGGGGGGAGGDSGPTPTPAPAVNIRALHNPASSQYDRECIKCHGDILEEPSLDVGVPGAHPVMIPQVGGETDAVCVKCHVTVDFDTHSAGNIRRQVDVNTCAACHATGGAGYPFYFR